MLTVIQSVVQDSVGLVLFFFAQITSKSGAQPAKPPDQSAVKAFFESLDWWIWALVAALIVLIVVFVIVRKKGQED